MKLADHFTRSGDFFFRWRSYLPLLLLPVFILGVVDAGRRPAASGPWVRAWPWACLVVSLAGLALRALTIGSGPAGTSERSTVDPRASVLMTDGPYSLVRHPLYLGNTLVALGLALVPGAWYVPVIVVLASLLYHERIAAREERFLEERFGDEFRRWADAVPAMVPAWGRCRPSPGRFRWRRVAGREFHGLLVIGAGFFLLDLGCRFAATGRVSLDPAWTALACATVLIYIVMAAVKRTTRLLPGD